MAFIRDQVAHFITGLIFWLPIAIIVLVSRYIFGNLEELGSDFLGIFIPHKFVYTGLGIAFWLLVFLITGLILKKTPVGSIFSRTPVLGVFFRQGGEVMTLDTLLTLSPCLFLYSPSCPSYGWILSEQPVKVDKEITDMILINVYYPNVPSMVTGQVYSVRKETVMRIGNPSKEMIDILLYGFRRPDNIRYIPWEGENEQDFKERSRCFGIA